jgi:hypothetical protein
MLENAQPTSPSSKKITLKIQNTRNQIQLRGKANYDIPPLHNDQSKKVNALRLVK